MTKEEIYELNKKPLDELMKLIKEDGSLIKHIGEKANIEMYLESIKQNWENIQYIDRHNLSGRVCSEAIKQNANAIFYILKKDKSGIKNYCLKAVEKDPLTIRFVAMNEIIDDEKFMKKLNLSSVKKNGLVIRYIIDYYLTEEICMLTVKENWESIYYIPSTKRTENMFLEASVQTGKKIDEKYIEETSENFILNILEDKSSIFYLKNEFITEKIALKTINNNPREIEYVPEEILTEEMCWESIKTDSYNVRYIPSKFMTERIISKIFNEYPENFSSIPEELISNEMNLKYYKKYPEKIFLVNKPKEFYLDILKENKSILISIPKKLIPEILTEEICLEIVNGDGLNIRMINFFEEENKFSFTKRKQEKFKLNKNFKTKLNLEAVKQNLKAVFYLNDDEITKEIEELVYENTNKTIKDLKSSGLSEDLYIEILEKGLEDEILCIPLNKMKTKTYKYLLKEVPLMILENGIPKDMDINMSELHLEEIRNRGFNSLMNVPKELITEEIVFEYIKNKFFYFDDIPEKFLTEELCLEIIKSSPSTINEFPKRFRTEEICKIAVRNSPYVMKYVPYEVITKELCLEALKCKGGDTYRYMPEKLRTKEMRDLSLKQSIFNIQYFDTKDVNEEMCWTL